MATKNRRVATYLSEELEAAFTKFKIDRQIGDSQALIAILSEFFGVSQEVAHQSSSLTTFFQDRVEALEEKLTHIKGDLLSELRRELLEHCNSSIEQVKAEVKTELLSELGSKLPINTEVTRQTGQLELIPDVQTSQGNEISSLLGESEGDIPSSSISESPKRNVEALSGTELAQRFGVHEKLPTNKRGLLKSDQRFAAWTKEQDPEGIAWRYEPNAKGKKKYFPVLDNESLGQDLLLAVDSKVSDSADESTEPISQVNPLP
jgi:hypothetical protein